MTRRPARGRCARSRRWSRRDCRCRESARRARRHSRLGQAAGDFIEQQQPRAARQGARQLQSLALRAGRACRRGGWRRRRGRSAAEFRRRRRRRPLRAACGHGWRRPADFRIPSDFSNGCGIWNERPMPAMQRARGGAWVMSWPSKWTGAAVRLEQPGDEIEQRRFSRRRSVR